MASGGWNTIESDAGVFTFLLDNLGVQGVQFEELLSLDPSSLQSLQPLYGVIFLFKYPVGSPALKADGTPHDGTLDHDAAERLFFASQTIQNACGTQALLSCLLNQGEAVQRGEITLGSELESFKEFASQLPPEYRGEVLSNSERIRDVHNSFARASPFVDETARDPGAESEDVFHFIAYTSVDGVLYELDGLMPAPISHGKCTAEEFPERVVPVLERRIGRYPETEIRFNLLAMVRDGRLRAQEIGDVEGLMREEQKRTEWQFENALRRHNFVGFAAEVLKMVVQQKLKDGGEQGYRKWVDDAVAKTRKRAEEREGRKERAGGDVEMEG